VDHFSGSRSKAILHHEVARESLRRRPNQVVEQAVVDPQRLKPRPRSPVFANGRERELDDDGENDRRAGEVPLERRGDARHRADHERRSIPGLLPNARLVVDALAPSFRGGRTGQPEFLGEGLDPRELDEGHVAVIARLPQVSGQLLQHAGECRLIAGIPRWRHRNFLAGFVAAVVVHGEIEAPEAKAERRLLEQPLRITYARHD
jgi:hypothetical protein